jgi:hypothetical protein
VAHNSKAHTNSSTPTENAVFALANAVVIGIGITLFLDR